MKVYGRLLKNKILRTHSNKNYAFFPYRFFSTKATNLQVKHDKFRRSLGKCDLTPYMSLHVSFVTKNGSFPKTHLLIDRVKCKADLTPVNIFITIKKESLVRVHFIP